MLTLMHVIGLAMVFAVWWLHVVVNVCTVALGVCVSSGSQTKTSFFSRSRQIFGIGFHGLVVKQSNI